jgi:uncharacterized repeat protein (TIGR03803 family)
MKFGKVVAFIAAAIFCAFNAHSQNRLAALIVEFDGANGGGPRTGMTLGIDGNLYGTTAYGGSPGGGTIFELTASNTFVTQAQFTDTNGSFPCAALLLATNDNFYGVTYLGGTYESGTIFEFTTNDELISLYTFDGTNGSQPWGGLIQASNGNFYGTTSGGGINATNASGGGGHGTIFMMDPQGTFSRLYNFTGGGDGSLPYGTLVQGTNGNLYGTTYYGGSSGSGVIFEWKLDQGFIPVLYFNGNNGANPGAGLIQGSNGFLYGTAASGGTFNDGVFFRVDYQGNLSPLHNFSGSDGATPYGPIVFCGDRYYGTTYAGGLYDYGTIYRLTMGSNQAPQFQSLFSFRDQTDGGYPEGGVTLFHGSMFVTTIESRIGSSIGEGSLIELIRPPRLTHVSLDKGVLAAYTFDLQPGWTYQPQYSQTLLAGSWSNWGSTLTAISNQYTFSGPATGPTGFLRLKFQPPRLLPP